MGEPTVTVTPWNTRPTQERPNGQYHDCLWQMAEEQAALDRMQRFGEDFKTASQKVTPEEHLKHLNTLCDDNGFRRIYSRGSGRDPNLVFDGEKIKVRIDPTKLTEPAPGVSDPKTGPAYTKAVQSGTGSGPDLKKKEQLDAWLNTVPGFKELPADIKTAWIEAYAREGVDATKLTKLAGAEAFKNLDDASKTQLLRLYGQKDQGIATAEIDKLLAAPGQEDKQRLVLMAAPGFAKLDSNQQKRAAVGGVVQVSETQAYACLQVQGDYVTVPRTTRAPLALQPAEAFWHFARLHLQMFRKIPVKFFQLYLAETCLRFNHRGEDLRALLKDSMSGTASSDLKQLLRGEIARNSFQQNVVQQNIAQQGAPGRNAVIASAQR